MTSSEANQRHPQPGGAVGLLGLSYVTLTVVACVALLVFGHTLDAVKYHTLALVALGGLAAASGARTIQRATGQLTVSIVSIVLLAAAALLPPGGATIVAIASALLPSASAPISWSARWFNLAMFGVLAGATTYFYILFGGTLATELTVDVSTVLLHLVIPLLTANVGMAVLNAVLLGGYLGIKEGVSPLGFAWSLLRSEGMAYIGHGVIGLMLAVLWGPVGLGVGAVVLVIGPLVVAQWAYQQVANETISHDRTVAALVAAAEADNIYTTGHSARVAEIAEKIAAASGRDSEQRKTLRMAALLHDIGTVAIPARTWRGDHTFSESEIEAYLEHPLRGVEILESIEFLRPVLNAIEHHHERWDGTGYPHELAGEDIPFDARAIAVADAFESLTATRSYRPAYSPEDALERLDELAGKQLDPDLVDALAGVLEREPWIGQSLEPEAIQAFGPAKDHDDPDFAEIFRFRGSPT